MCNKVLHYNWNMLWAYQHGMDTISAQRFAWFSEGPDQSTPENCAKISAYPVCDRLITQVRWNGSGAILLATNDYWWEEFRNVVFFHFGGGSALDGPACAIGAMRKEFEAAFAIAKETRELHDIAKAGILKHIFDDSAAHCGFYGYPTKGNIATARLHCGRLSFWQALFPTKEAWGHILAPHLDEIQHCGARIHQMHKTLAFCDAHCSCYDMLERAQNDKHLLAMCNNALLEKRICNEDRLELKLENHLMYVLWVEGRKLLAQC